MLFDAQISTGREVEVYRKTDRWERKKGAGEGMREETREKMGEEKMGEGKRE
jgi:hypothetical protein